VQRQPRKVQRQQRKVQRQKTKVNPHLQVVAVVVVVVTMVVVTVVVVTVVVVNVVLVNMVVVNVVVVNVVVASVVVVSVKVVVVNLVTKTSRANVHQCVHGRARRYRAKKIAGQCVTNPVARRDAWLGMLMHSPMVAQWNAANQVAQLFAGGIVLPVIAQVARPSAVSQHAA